MPLCERCDVEKEPIPKRNPKGGHYPDETVLRCPKCANWDRKHILCLCGTTSSSWPLGTLSCVRCRFNEKHGLPSRVG